MLQVAKIITKRHLFTNNLRSVIKNFKDHCLKMFVAASKPHCSIPEPEWGAEVRLIEGVNLPQSRLSMELDVWWFRLLSSIYSKMFWTFAMYVK